MEKCSDMKMEAAANDSTEEMHAIFTSESGEDAIKSPLFPGLTSGSFLTGLSSGLIFSGKEYIQHHGHPHRGGGDLLAGVHLRQVLYHGGGD